MADRPRDNKGRFISKDEAQQQQKLKDQAAAMDKILDRNMRLLSYEKEHLQALDRKVNHAKELNALFGEYTYDFSNGVVPLLRENGEKHLVKAFDSVDKSVQSYFNNLNSHYAYKDFRSVRKVMRENNNFNNIKLLVNELDTYAADKNYINTINSIIDINKLNKLDKFNYSETES